MIIEFCAQPSSKKETVSIRNWPVVPRVGEGVVLPTPDDMEITGIVRSVGYRGYLLEENSCPEPDPLLVQVLIEVIERRPRNERTY
jgi:hypothetical protein